MSSLFEKHQNKLEEILAGLSPVTLEEYPFLIKGDVSGIQEFIFHVRSEKAAKILKGRSFYIQAITDIAVFRLEEELKKDCVTLYNGGGNFYLLAKREPDLQNLRKEIARDCLDEVFYLFLSCVQVRSNDFGQERFLLEKELQKEKFRAFYNAPQSFTPYRDRNSNLPWADWTSKFVRSNGLEPFSVVQGSKTVEAKRIVWLDTNYSLSSRDNQFQDRVINSLPQWNAIDLKWYKSTKEGQAQLEADDSETKTDFIIEFSSLAALAKIRTGTGKLGVLKMDIDDLGQLFNGVNDIGTAQRLSRALTWFFDEFFFQLQSETFSQLGSTEPVSHMNTYGDNLYIVYAGGDDCFVLGAWDAVFQFAGRLRSEFKAFTDFLKSQFTGLPEHITLSAGLIVVNPKYPIIQLAKQAEEALDYAKSWRKEKDLIAVFGEALSWEEYEKAAKHAALLAEMVNEGYESRAILERIKRSAQGYEKMQKEAAAGKLRAPKVWRLFYYLGKRRRVSNAKAEDRQKKIAELLQDYSKGLMKVFVGKQGTSHMVFPIAARWAEFLTKKRSNSQSHE